MVKQLAGGIFLGSLLLYPSIALSQEELPARTGGMLFPDTTRRNFTGIGFDKSFTTFHWLGSCSYATVAGPLALDLHEAFLSTLIDASPQLITDNQSLDAHLADRLSETIALTGKVSSYVNSNNRDVGITNASSHGFYGGVAMHPVPGLSLEPMAGLRLDTQGGVEDRGASYLISVRSDSLQSGGYDTDINGSYQVDEIHPRLLETGNALLHVEKVFFEQTRNYLGVQFYRNRRDFYAAADTTIQRLNGVTLNITSRSDNSLNLFDTLDYGVGNSLLMRFAGTVFSRQITSASRYNNTIVPNAYTPNTSIDETRVEGSVSLQYRPNERLASGVLFGYYERDENHSLQPDAALSASVARTLSENEERKDNISRRYVLSGFLAGEPSNSDSVAVSGSGSLLHYDTPSSDNDDDRDELLALFNLSTRHVLSRSLSIRTTTDLTLYHLVYLFSTKSANNTWNRILRFSPTLWYTPADWFFSVNTFEVLANYTVYDFEFISSSPQSFSFRQFSFVDSTSFALTRRLSLEWFSIIRTYERGELHWDEFSERPVNLFDEKTFIGTVRYALTERLLFSIGIRYFSQTRYGYAGADRTLENLLHSTGPLAAISMNVGARTELALQGWYERQTQTGQPDRGLTTMTLYLNVRI
ncbi:MAG TPA: hypothetical protein VLY03_05940 [Bacteroidota bacterium]|nr:hypothetical protein [Bacteroidota bacterium]